MKSRLRYKELLRNGISTREYYEEVKNVLALIKEGNFRFELIRSKDYYKINNLVHKLVLRQVNYRLKKTYKDFQGNRKTIINQIVTLLYQESEYFIIRSDVSSFYESINKDVLLNKIQNDRILNYESVYLIKSILNNPVIEGSGLPRGLSISSTLSEMYMRNFDKRVRALEGVYYYARFVDDIVIFVTTKEVQTLVAESIQDWLPNGLLINKKKTKLSSSSQLIQGKSFEYLGYKFEVQKIKNEIKPKVSIATKKLKKIKSRILYSFAAHCHQSDFSLLCKRLDFLSCNYILRGGKRSKLMAGISYSYGKVTHHQDLDDLNMYYHKILNCKSFEFGNRIKIALSNDQIQRLKKISFKHRFKNKVVKRFDVEKLSLIKRCWAHEN